MKRLSFCLILCFSILLFGKNDGRVREINNCWRDGKPVLVPAVQQAAYGKDYYVLPAVVTVTVPDAESLLLEQLFGELRRFPGISLKASSKGICRFEVTNQGVPKNPQGYRLQVNGNGILIQSSSLEGLYFGGQTLRNLLRNAAKPQLLYCDIRDWPDMEKRGYVFSIRDMRNADLPALKRSLDALSSLKINWLEIEIAQAFPYSKNEFSRRKTSFTRQQMEDLAEFCRRRHMEITPSLQVMSHCLWMTYHPDWEKMREGAVRNPWNNQCCPLNEQARALTEMAIDEQIAMFHPKSFSICLDEICLCPFQQCAQCKARPALDILKEYLAFAENAVLKHGVTPIVCQDSFENNPKWLYGETFRTYLNPKTQVKWWSYADHLNEERFRQFVQYHPIGHALNGKPLNLYNMAKMVKKYGGTECQMVYWYYSIGGFLHTFPNKETPDSLGGLVNGADYLWKLTDEPYSEFPYDGTLEMMRRLGYVKEEKRPFQGKNAVPILLNSVLNAELSASGEFPALDDSRLQQVNRILAAQPEKFRLVTEKGGKYYGVRVTGSKADVHGRQAVRITLPKQLPVGEGFSLLMTAGRPWDSYLYNAALVRGRKRLKYETAAYFKFEYEDGSSREVPLRYRWEFTSWNRPFGGFGMRYVVRGLDTAERFFNFCLLEIPNPLPEKKIKSVVFRSALLDDISPVILAMSLWSKTPCPAPPITKNFDGRKIANPYKGINSSKADQVVEDFENGMGKVQVTLRGGGTADKEARYSGTVRMEIVQMPGRGKVLKVTVPTALPRKASGRPRYYRVDISLPYEMPKNARLIFSSIRLENGSGLNHCNDYLLGEDDSHWVYTLGSQFPEWKDLRVSLGTATFSDKVLKDFSKTRRRMFSFFFRELKEPAVIYIDGIGHSTLPYAPGAYWTPNSECEPL